MPHEVIILIGLQASGKSSFARRFANTHRIISKDEFPNNRRPERRQRQLVEEALAAGQSVLIDNTNPTPADRAALIELARRFSARVLGYYLESRLAACKERNASRDSVNRVPDVALYSTIKRLTPPSLAEGFDELHFVRLGPDGTFMIEAWQEKGADGEAERPG